MTLALAYEQSNQLRELATFNERNETMFAVAKVLEGLLDMFPPMQLVW